MRDSIASSGKATTPFTANLNSVLACKLRCNVIALDWVAPPAETREKTMRPRGTSRSGFAIQLLYGVIAILFIALLSPGNSVALAQQTDQQNAAPAEEAPKIPNDQLDSLVAPIALYPDPLLAQTLAASTYPLEIIQLEQWMKKNKDLKGNALADAVERQNWDPSIQAMAVFPDVVKQLAENVSWTSDLGNAFLAQQEDVMDAVQRMRAKAQGAGNLKSSQQQKVESKTVESKNVIVIEQASPDVVYVPAYNPTVVYGAPPPYPYPSMYYPPGYGMLAFGAGVAIGAAWGGGGWGYGCGWGRGDVNINYNNKYVNHYNKNNNINRGQQGGKWQHRPEHRGSAPYGDRNTANRFGGNARQQPGGGLGNRPGGGVGAGNIGAGRPGGGAGIANRPGGGNGMGNRPGGGAGIGNRPGGGPGIANRPAGGTGIGNRPGGGAGLANRPGGGAGIGSGRPSTMPATRPSGGGANRIGNQNLGGGSRGGGGFGGGSGSYNRASSSRGGHSMGGGGFSRGGGGGRGGGGRRR